jgi:hypothetical protein
MKISPLIPGFCTVVLLLPLTSAIVRAEDNTPVMPLSDIKPGMTGEWHTVVSGTRIDSFPMQVVSSAPTPTDFSGRRIRR